MGAIGGKGAFCEVDVFSELDDDVDVFSELDDEELDDAEFAQDEKDELRSYGYDDVFINGLESMLYRFGKPKPISDLELWVAAKIFFSSFVNRMIYKSYNDGKSTSNVVLHIARLETFFKRMIRIETGEDIPDL